MNSKKRILFVDDEEMILEVLRRMLRPLTNEWEMNFAADAEEALAQMEQAPFDVVVSDMRMPGLNGAELLSEVMKRYPRTQRLIHSGYADRELILQCVGSTHQYLAKPCTVETLRGVLRRAAALDDSLGSETLKQLLGRLDRLPSIPALYVELVQKLQNPEVDLDEVAAVISKDMAMTAKMLKLVNSAFFGLQCEVNTPAEAASYLGLDTIKSLVLSIQVFSQFEDACVPGFSLDHVWPHSLQTAMTARAVAESALGDRKISDESFVAGLLHDAGKLLLASHLGSRYSEALRLVASGQRAPLEAEREVLGGHHGEVGGYLFGLWGLPLPVVEAVILHHTPRLCPEPAFSPLTAVHVADVIVHENAGSHRPGGKPAVDMEYLESLGMADQFGDWKTLWSPSAESVG
ncbi:MAG: HDOD domain-containing protein [Limisphaerales bacterium]